MNLLVDTHILLWLLNEPQRIPVATVRQMASPENQLFASSLSIFECMIKAQLGKLKIPANLIAAIKDQGMDLLSFTAEHAATVSELSLHHRDPFDRGLLAQARSERLSLITADRELLKYRPEVEVIAV